MKCLMIFLLSVQVTYGQISIDSLITLSRAKDDKSQTLLSNMIFKNSTVQIRQGAKGYTKVDSKINTYEAKNTEIVPLIETMPRYLKTRINGTELFFSSKDYVNNSISSPLMDTITVHFINNSEKIKTGGINEKLLSEITKLSYTFDVMVKADTTFESETIVSLSKTDHTFLGRQGKYYKLLIPSIIEQPVFTSKRALDNKVIAFNKDIIKKFIPRNHINFFSPETSPAAGSKGTLVSSFSSGGYSSETYRQGNTYITTTTFNGEKTTSYYNVSY